MRGLNFRSLLIKKTPSKALVRVLAISPCGHIVVNIYKS